MKLSTNTNNYTTTITKSADFGIEESDLSHIMGILRSQIYSDKLLAVIREYSTNAVDANTEANNTNPISIILPTLENPILSFRDFGNGLSDDEVCNLYVKYGASTKRSSNDYTGCLGIGCKAGFAYGDSFQVVSYTKSHITTWLARIDESQRGTISLISKEPNINKPTGTNVIVSIRKNDIDDCVSKAKAFFKYWKVQPHCNLDLDKLNIVESTDDWALCTSSSRHAYARNYGSAHLVMGNIRYPIDSNQLNLNSTPASLTKSDSIIFYAPLGAVDIAANRESLEYTDRTRDAIVAMTNNMFIDLVSRLKKYVENEPSRIKASIASDKYSSILPRDAEIAIRGKCTWRGLELLNSIRFGADPVKCHEKVKVWSSNNGELRNKSSEATSTSLSKRTILTTYSDDKIAASNATRRIRTLQYESTTDKTDLYYVIPKSKLSEVSPQLTSNDYIDLDNIEPLKPTRTASTITNNTTKKSVRINVCQLTPSSLKSSRLSKETEPTAMADGRYVYVPLDRFDWAGHGDWLDALDEIQSTLYFLHTECVDTTKPTIHGVKKHHIKKLDTQWITLDAYLAELFTTWQLNNPDDASLYSQITSKAGYNVYNQSMSGVLSECADIDIARYGRVISKFNTIRPNTKTKDNLYNMYKIMIYLKITDQSTYIDDMTTYMNKHYPLLSHISIPYYSSDIDLIKQHILQYINSVKI